MELQYEDIGGDYNAIKRLPTARVEIRTFHQAVSPIIQNANVLDLACGAGFYGHLMLRWGARRVVGVDIAEEMINAAIASVQNEETEQLEFMTGDCTRPRHIKGGPFDVVTGVWLLNYAGTRVEMVKIFENIRLNLKRGGYFVGIVPYTTDDIESLVEALQQPDMKKYGVEYTYDKSSSSTHEGCKCHLVAHTDPKIEFDTFHLKQRAFEGAAREAGLGNNLEWIMPKFPTSEEDKALGIGKGYWDLLRNAPHCCGIIAQLSNKEQPN